TRKSQPSTTDTAGHGGGRFPPAPVVCPMSHGQWRFKPSEIARAVKSVKSTGLPLLNVEISPEGLIRINVGEPQFAAKADLDERLEDQPQSGDTSAPLPRLMPKGSQA